ncbi:hypothetical protein ACHAWF_015016 [Thalassiosira exigua]
MVPDLKHKTLLSGSKFADAGYVTVLTPTELLIYDEKDYHRVDKEAVLRGWRDKGTGLWNVPLEENPSPSFALPKEAEEALNNVYELPSTEQVVRYLHACAGFPTKKTWLKAIKGGNFASWPLLTEEAVRKHFPESDETKQGHMKGIKQGIRSTKTKKEPTTVTLEDGTELTMPLRKHHDVYLRVEEARETMYTDQTGAFPVQSRRGNRYVMILCEMDNNVIMSAPMKNRTAGSMVEAYRALMKRLKRAGIKPKKHVLDNEASAEFKEAIEDEGVSYELVPKGQHQRNIAERYIQTWKAHAIGVLSGVPSTFPLAIWDDLLPQIDMQVNLLRFSNVAPNVCSWTVLHGPHDFNRHPLAPLGSELHMHVPPDKRKSWGVKSRRGHYVGTSLEHYRYYWGYFSDTRAIAGSETVSFKHKYITTPTVTPADAIVQAARQLANALKGNVPPPLVKSGIDHIKELTSIFDDTKTAYEDRAQAEQAAQREKRTHPPRVRRSKRARARASMAEEEEPPELALTDDSSDEEEEEECVIPSRPSSEASPRLVVASSAPVIVASPTPTPPKPRHSPMPNVISQEEPSSEAPAANTRSRRIQRKTRHRSISDEVMLSCVEMSSHTFSPRQAAARQYPLALLCELAGAVLDANTGELLEYRHLIKHPHYQETWGDAFGKEVGRLAQGLPGIVEGTDTIDFIMPEDVPSDRRKDCTYVRIVCNERPEKADPNRVRITVGGNRINYPGDCGTPTADLLTVKLLFNSVISTEGAKFMTMDISNFYLNTPLKRKEYVRMKLDNFPSDVIDHYNLKAKATKDGFVFVAVKRGMYGLPQAGILAQELLEKRLAKHGYHQSKITPGLWTHEWRPICFTLVVDDFGVKYVGREHAEHLVGVVKEHYDLTEDWEGKRYLGLTLDWDYSQKKVHLSMPDYIPDALKRFNHKRPAKAQNSPHQHVPPNYGAKQQFTQAQDDEPELSPDDKKYVQQVLGTFLYYARAVDCTMLVALSAIASEQANPTTATMAKVKQFLDYAASQEEAVLTYHASDMVLAAHSDASYLSERKSRSRAGGHFYCSNDEEFPPNNGAVLTVAQIIKAVMSSAAEAEVGALYINAREAIPARHALEKMGHKQPPTPIQTDNSAAHAVVSTNVAPRRLKAMDMRFWWLRDREAQNMFRFFWRPGPYNKGDYFTKHYPSSHHVDVRKEFITPQRHLADLRRRREKARLGLELAQAITASSHATRVC